MRAREFTINVPITIKINGDGDPEVDAGQQGGEEETPELDPNPVMVPPLQQKMELLKHAAGKQSDVIDTITADDNIETE
jgi:hypothetical protein